MNYFIGDFLIRIKNAYMAHKRSIELPYSKQSEAIGKILAQEKFVKKSEAVQKENYKVIQMDLLYTDRKAALTDVRLVSRPSVHVYAKKTAILKSMKGSKLAIVSTSKGVMTSKEAQKQQLGGEIICQIS